MVEKEIGVPPPLYTPFFTAAAISFRCLCPGIISLAELAIPIRGRLISCLLRPRAYNKERCGALLFPCLTLSLFIKYLPYPYSLLIVYLINNYITHIVFCQ